jgi:hypothetical protein
MCVEYISLDPMVGVVKGRGDPVFPFFVAADVRLIFTCCHHITWWHRTRQPLQLCAASTFYAASPLPP